MIEPLLKDYNKLHIASTRFYNSAFLETRKKMKEVNSLQDTAARTQERRNLLFEQ